MSSARSRGEKQPRAESHVCSEKLGENNVIWTSKCCRGLGGVFPAPGTVVNLSYFVSLPSTSSVMVPDH